MYVLGGFAKGLVVYGALACIRLLQPSGTLCHNILAFLGQISELGDSWVG